MLKDIQFISNRFSLVMQDGNGLICKKLSRNCKNDVAIIVAIISLEPLSPRRITSTATSIKTIANNFVDLPKLYFEVDYSLLKGSRCI